MNLCLQRGFPAPPAPVTMDSQPATWSGPAGGIVREADGTPLSCFSAADKTFVLQPERCVCAGKDVAAAAMWRLPPSCLPYSRDGEALWYCFELTKRCQLCPKKINNLPGLSASVFYYMSI